ncbi:MAG: hypothetical protein EB014_05685, partial [Actinobacteria bacterium]|nr:hypothetical protein [Actinomycetota bacterium]
MNNSFVHHLSLSPITLAPSSFIESVKRKRRLTWSLISASAQILSVDNEQITIGIVNAGARD